jgi:hypothetical protein
MPFERVSRRSDCNRQQILRVRNPARRAREAKPEENMQASDTLRAAID